LTIIVPTGLRVHKHELETAERLAALGFLIEFMPPSSKPGVKSADVRLDGELWELKSPIGSGERTIDNQLHRAEKQSARLVIDLARTNIIDDKAVREVQRRMKSRVHILSVIIVMHDGTLVRIDRR